MSRLFSSHTSELGPGARLPLRPFHAHYTPATPRFQRAADRHLPYVRDWSGFNAVVAVHPSQLRQRKFRRYTFDENAFRTRMEFARVRRASSTAWETPNSKDAQVQFAKVVNNDDKFNVKINLDMFDMFDREEIDVNVYGYDIQIHGEKENPVNPNRPLRILNRQYRLPDDVDLKTVQMKRKDSEVDVDAKKIPNDYGAPIALRVTDVTQTGKKLQSVSGY